MRVEFNESSLSANMNGFAYTGNNEVDIKVLLRYSTSLIFGVVSVIMSLCLIPCAIFANVLSSIQSKLDGSVSSSYLLLLLSAGVLITCITIGTSVCSMLFYSKSKKSKPDAVGVILSALSIVVCVGALTIGIISVLI